MTWIEDLESFTATQAKRFEATACGGDDEGARARCTEAVAAACALRTDSGCPRARLALAAERDVYAAPRPQSWLEEAGVPTEIALAALELDAAPAGAAQLAVRSHFTASRRPILLLRGDPAALAAPAVWAMVLERTGLFMPGYGLEAIKWDTDGIKRIARVKLLVLHDLGSEFVDAPKPEESRIVAVLERTIAERALNGRDTVITTGVEDLRTRYGGAVWEMLNARADSARFGARRT